RDGHKCTKCETDKELHVHHLAYLKDGQPWEVPNTWLITLCKAHHKEIHKGKVIPSYNKVGDWKGKLSKQPVKKNEVKPPKKKKRTRKEKRENPIPQTPKQPKVKTPVDISTFNYVAICSK